MLKYQFFKKALDKNIQQNILNYKLQNKIQIFYQFKARQTVYKHRIQN